MNSPRGKGREREREKGISSFGTTPASPSHLSSLHARHQICTPVLYPPPSLLPPLACPTMIQPLLIALPHYCPTFMALPHYHPVRPPAPSPAGRHPPADVTYHVRRCAGETRQGRVVSPLRRERVALAGAQEAQEAHRCQASARVPRESKGARVTPNLGSGGGECGPSGAEIRYCRHAF